MRWVVGYTKCQTKESLLRFRGSTLPTLHCQELVTEMKMLSDFFLYGGMAGTG